MRLILKVIRWKNFLSTGNYWTEIELDKSPTTLIVGKNGSGKTTFLDALSFVLFNKSFRKINKPQLVNSIVNKECVVEVEFIINGYKFKVVRGIKPTLFEIWKDGELLTQNSDNRDYQETFEKYIIRVNHKTFCQIVMLGSAIFTPFMALPAHLRREVIEDLLDLKIFTRMNLLLKDKMSKLEYDLYEKGNEKKILEERVSLTTQHFEEMKAQKEKIIIDKEDKIKEYSTIINDNLEEITALEVQIGEIIKDFIDKKTIKTKEVEKLYNQFGSKIKTIEREIDFLKTNESCPTCNQTIEEEFKCLTIHSKENTLADLFDASGKLLLKLNEEERKQETNDNIQQQVLSNENTIKSLVDQNAFYKNSIDSMKKEIEDIKVNLENVTTTTNIDDLNKELIELDSKMIGMNDDRNVMGFAVNLLKDSGIKSQFIRIYIPIINQLIQKYLAALDFYVEFTLDENFEEKIRSRFRDEFSFESFSEGEKVRLNIAVLMTWRAIAKMRGSIDCNLLVFDELFDGSLDNEGLEDIMKLLGNLTNNENIIIISHREDQISDKFERVLKFEKIRNFSKVV